MRNIFIAALLVLMVFGLEAKSKKVELFNGEDLKGWVTYGGTADFKVLDGVLIGVSKAGTPSTFLATKKKYTNFVLEYDILVGKGLNSGVQIRSQYDKEKEHLFGPQVEGDDSERSWSCGIYDQGRKGWRYPLEYNPCSKKAFRNGEWNRVKVIAFENRIAVWLNGVNTVNLVEETVETGFIALQVHAAGKDKEGVENKWRNISITELDDAPCFANLTAPEVSYLKNTLTDKELSQGWKLLWDGETTQGWRGAKRDDFPAKGWSINDGVLQVHASGGGESENGGDIVTTRPFKNFILEVDFKITKGANSGIKYFVDTDLNKGSGSAIGCEFQILDDKNHPDAKKGVGSKRTVGSLYDLIKADSRLFVEGLRPLKYMNNGWNRARVEVRGSKVKHVLNGCTVVEYERGTQQWKALVAYSKYAKWPNFGEAEEGLILLQDHGDDVFFKNIKIKELN